MKTLIVSLVLGSIVLSSCDSSAIGAETSIGDAEDDVQAAVETTEAVPESYQYEAYEDEDKPFADISRRSLAIEIKEYPIDETRLLATLAAIADSYQGETNAISVRAHWDRRESEPSFGVWVWAPEGTGTKR